MLVLHIRIRTRIFCSLTPCLLSSSIKWSWSWCQFFIFETGSSKKIFLGKVQIQMKINGLSWLQAGSHCMVLYCKVFSLRTCELFEHESEQWLHAGHAAVMTERDDCSTACMTSQWVHILEKPKTIIPDSGSLLWPGHWRQLRPARHVSSEAISIFLKPGQEMMQLCSVLIQSQNICQCPFSHSALETDWLSLTLSHLSGVLWNP